MNGRTTGPSQKNFFFFGARGGAIGARSWLRPALRPVSPLYVIGFSDSRSATGGAGPGRGVAGADRHPRADSASSTGLVTQKARSQHEHHAPGRGTVKHRLVGGSPARDSMPAKDDDSLDPPETVGAAL